jgi:hypothetical protein
MDGWVALSDRDEVLGGVVADAMLAKGTFILEFDLPLIGSVVLLDYKSTDGWPRGFSLFVDEMVGVVVLHRQGDRLIRHVLPGPLQLSLDGAARVVFSWDGPAKLWSLRLEQTLSGLQRDTRGRDPMPLLRDDLLALCSRAGRTVRHSSVLWYGVKLGDTPPTRAPWVGLQTPIETGNGPCAAGYLRAGDLVLTVDGDLIPIQSIRHMDLPSRGTFSPILLRAPYFGAKVDLLVSSDQLVALSGAEVEYLFAEDEVLTAAGHLTDGRAALKDLRHSVTSCVSIDLGELALMMADGCTILSHFHGPVSLQPETPHRVLHSYEAIPLLAQLGRASSSNAA